MADGVWHCFTWDPATQTYWYWDRAGHFYPSTQTQDGFGTWVERSLLEGFIVEILDVGL